MQIPTGSEKGDPQNTRNGVELSIKSKKPSLFTVCVVQTFVTRSYETKFIVISLLPKESMSLKHLVSHSTVGIPFVELHPSQAKHLTHSEQKRKLVVYPDIS